MIEPKTPGDHLRKRTEEERDRIRRYRRLFTTPEGRWVLNDILYLLEFWNPNVNAKDAERLAYQNFARHLLRCCGLLNPRNIRTGALVNSWLDLQCLEITDKGEGNE